MKKLTVDEFRRLAQSSRSRPAVNKYRAQKTGGYDSRREYDRAQQLKLMERAGEIADLREQVAFLLLPARRNDTGYLERAVRYIADFVYTDLRSGQTVVEDTKGVRTKEYIIKRKLMLAVHGITIREI